MSIELEATPEEMGMSSAHLEHLTRHMHAYVDDGRLPGVNTLVSRGGKIVYLDKYGERDMEKHLPVVADTVYRFYSMSKPITSIAFMQLYEQGRVKLSDPVEKFLPSFKNMNVLIGGTNQSQVTRPASTVMNMHHLMTHMSGLTYGFMQANVVDAVYRANGFDFGSKLGNTEETIDALAALPLLCDPGARWNYSHSTDVIGRVIEVISGQKLGDYLQEHVLGPLGMSDTGFSVKEDARERFSSNYIPHPKTGKATLLDASDTSPALKPAEFEGGGGGLMSTMHDYHQFCRMLMAGGTLGDVRIIGRKTLDFMTSNHLPGGGDLVTCGTPLFSETPYDGVGFGLGFSVQLDPAITQVISSPGEFAWGGAASTSFWCDPAEDLHVIFLTQLLPSSFHPIRPELKQLVYSALL